MFDNINNDGILNNSSINSRSKIVQLSSNAHRQAYKTNTDLLDQTEISDSAIQKYEQEQEIKKYKNIVLNMLKFDETASNSKAGDIKNMIANNNFEIDEKTLAGVLANDSDLLSMLF